MCFQASLDLFTSVGPILVLHTPCGAVKWIYIVGEDWSDVNNSTKYLNVGTVPNALPLTVIVEG